MGNKTKANRKFTTDGLVDPKTNQDYNMLKPDPSDPNQIKSVRPDDEIEPTLKEQNDAGGTGSISPKENPGVKDGPTED